MEAKIETKPSRALLKGVAALVLAMCMGSMPAFAGDGGAAGRKQCEFQFVPVSLAPQLPATSRIATWLCYEGSPVGKTVQLLIHGATFNHYMWDFPLAPITSQHSPGSTRWTSSTPKWPIRP